MMDPTEQNSQPIIEGEVTPPAVSTTSNRSLVAPLLIVGIIAAGLLCIISVIGVMAFFVIVNVDEDIAGIIGTVVISEDSAANSDEAGLNGAATGEVLFAETFDSADNGWQTGVVEDESGRGEVAIADGVYTLSVSGDQPAYVERELPDREFSDFHLTVDITPHDAQEHYSYGVTFRQNEDFESYVIELGNDGLYAIFLFTDKWVALEDWTFSEAIEPGQTNQLTIRAEGSRLTFLVNDRLLTTIEDDTLAAGTVGLVVETFAEGASARVNFDNLMIRKP